MIKELLDLQLRIHQFYTMPYENDGIEGMEDESWMATETEDAPKLFFMPRGDLIEIDFYGDGNDENLDLDSMTAYSNHDDGWNFPFIALMEFLSDQENANRILSLNFRGPETGANGTKEWCFKRLVSTGVEFPQLRRFAVELSEPARHNTPIIEYEPSSYEEGGMLARLLAKMPALEYLQTPSAPNESFFELAPLPLEEMVVQAGYNRENFIENLAKSNNLPKLGMLDYSDYMFVHSEKAGSETPYSAYKSLFESPLFEKGESFFNFTLRYSTLTREQLSALMTLKVGSRVVKRNTVFKYIDCHNCEYIEPNPYWK